MRYAPYGLSAAERRRQKEEQKKAPNKQQVATFESLSLKRYDLNQEQIRLKRDLVEMGTVSPVSPADAEGRL